MSQTILTEDNTKGGPPTDWARLVRHWLHDYSPLGILATDTKLTITYWNRWLEAHSDRHAADVVGQGLLAVYPELVEKGLDRYYRDALAGQVQILSYRFHRYLLPLPSPYYPTPELMAQSVQIAPLSSEGQVVGTITLIEDVTERVEREKALQDSNQELAAALEELTTTQQQVIQQERLAAVGQLAAGIAHDFNNILAGILLAANVLLQEPGLPEKGQQNLARILAQSQRAAHLVQQILDFSRKSIRQLQPFDLAALLQEWTAALRRTTPANIRIRQEIEPGEYVLQADLAQIRQILANLSDNACAAMPHGGDLTFRLSPLDLQPGEAAPLADLSAGRWLLLSVEDTGVGIAPEALPHIFEPFFTTKEVGQGSGLGLAQVYGIVRQHQGQITVESQVGRGTTVKIYLPVPAGEQVPLTEEVAKSVPSRDKTILVVEKDEGVLEVVQITLQAMGYAVRTAQTSQEALQVYGEYGPEIALVLLDWQLSQAEPAAFQALVQTWPRTLPVVAVSHYPANRSGPGRPDLNVVAWLQKPFSDEEMAATVQAALSEGWR